MTRPAVFLDRDGVLNRPVVRNGQPFPPSTVDELELMPDVVAACDALKKARLLLIVVTNQPDLARGTVTQETVDAINAKLREQLPLSDVLVCPHDDAQHCGCRKPRPGMLLAATAHWGVDLSRSAMVGDRWRDVDAGVAAGCQTVFVDHGYDEPLRARPNHTVASLLEAVPWLVDHAGTAR